MKYWTSSAGVWYAVPMTEDGMTFELTVWDRLELAQEEVRLLAERRGTFTVVDVLKVARNWTLAGDEGRAVAEFQWLAQKLQAWLAGAA